MATVGRLELIDDLQRLGISFHFDNEIKQILNSIYKNKNYKKKKKREEKIICTRQRLHSDYSETMTFQFLKNENEDFRSRVGDDTRGVLQLYEASFLLIQGEETLEMAKEFATKILQTKLADDNELADDIRNALELPIHWRIQRPNARCSIEAYGRRTSHRNIPTLLLQLAKLDFNTLQSIHQQELKLVSGWDVEAMDQLSKYMQMCFLTLNNFINEMAYNVLKEQHILITQHLRNYWIDLCRTYTQEATWYATGYKPTLDEYMSNAWILISAPIILTHAFFLITNPIQEHAIHNLYKYHHIVQASSMILRLANDLGTSPYEMERGDVPKSVQCYKNEIGGSTEEAREHVQVMIWEAWKKMNEERVGNSPFSETFVRSAVVLGRMAQYIYQHGDCHGIQNPKIKERISTLLFQPV